MVYRRRFLSNPHIDFPPAAAEPEVVAEPEVIAEPEPEPEPEVVVPEPEPEVVIVEPKAPKRAAKAKKTPIAE